MEPHVECHPTLPRDPVLRTLVPSIRAVAMVAVETMRRVEHRWKSSCKWLLLRVFSLAFLRCVAHQVLLCRISFFFWVVRHHFEPPCRHRQYCCVIVDMSFLYPLSTPTFIPFCELVVL